MVWGPSSFWSTSVLGSLQGDRDIDTDIDIAVDVDTDVDVDIDVDIDVEVDVDIDRYFVFWLFQRLLYGALLGEPWQVGQATPSLLGHLAEFGLHLLKVTEGVGVGSLP